MNSEISKKTGVYPMIDVKICASRDVAKVPDLLTGGMRKRKYGMVLSMSGFPNFSQVQEPIMTPIDMPSILVDADSLDDLRERAILEVEGMIEQLRDALDQIKAEKANATRTQEDPGEAASTLRKA